MSYSEMRNYFIAEQPDWWHYVLAVLFVAVVLAAILAWPLALIWSVNTLFPLLSIPYSFSTWLAVVAINISTFGGLGYKLSKISDKL